MHDDDDDQDDDYESMVGGARCVCMCEKRMEIVTRGEVCKGLVGGHCIEKT